MATESDTTPSEGASKSKRLREPKARKTPGRSVDVSRARKVAYLLSLEIRRITEDLEWRRYLLIELWTRMRLREPLVSVLKSRYDQFTAQDLLLLPATCLGALDTFFRTVDEFVLYLKTTEDMPTSLEHTYSRYQLKLFRLAESVLKELDSLHRLESLATPTRGGRSDQDG